MSKSISYLIDTPAYDKAIGGICAMHYLADCLHRHGINSVYLTTNQKNPRWYGCCLKEVIKQSTKFDFLIFLYQALLILRSYVFFRTFQRKIDRKLRKIYLKIIWKFFDIDKTVVIYPETTIGNPLNAKHVVRWILYNPDTNVPGAGVYAETDHIFLYLDFYKVNSEYKVSGVMTAIDLEYHLHTFQDQGNVNRSGGAYLVKKGHGKPLNKHPRDYIRADDILRNMSDQQRAIFFNRIREFISYDPVTFFSTQAALCGCLSIVIPDEEGEYSKLNLIRMNRQSGVAYGLDDTEWAKATQAQLRKDLELQNQNNIATVRNFIEYCEANINVC